MNEPGKSFFCYDSATWGTIAKLSLFLCQLLSSLESAFNSS